MNDTKKANLISCCVEKSITRTIIATLSSSYKFLNVNIVDELLMNTIFNISQKNAPINTKR